MKPALLGPPRGAPAQGGCSTQVLLEGPWQLSRRPEVTETRRQRKPNKTRPFKGVTRGTHFLVKEAHREAPPLRVPCTHPHGPPAPPAPPHLAVGAPRPPGTPGAAARASRGLPVTPPSQPSCPCPTRPRSADWGLRGGPTRESRAACSSPPGSRRPAGPAEGQGGRVRTGPGSRPLCPGLQSPSNSNSLSGSSEPPSPGLPPATHA